MSEIPSAFVTPLDTTDFDQLVELGRSLIPRYAPDWTDHNLHDPGMTVLDLLAWIVDQQVYRTGFVGGRHRLTFSALLGQRPRGPRPARGVIWPRRRLPEGRLVPEGADIACVAHPTLRFVLARAVYLTSRGLVRAHLTIDGADLPAPSSDLDGVTWVLGNGVRLAATALTLSFDGPLGRPGQSAPVSFGFDVAPPPGPAPSAAERPWGPVTYEYRSGCRGPWTRLAVEHDGTSGMALTGHVVLEIPPAAPDRADGSELRMSFDRGFFPVPPHVRAICVNALPIVQIERIAPALFGASGTGQPDQTVALVTSDLVDPPSRPNGPALEVEVGRERWEERPDLSRSGPDDPHYAVRPDHIQFGNGLNGRRPPLGAPIAHTELARTAGAAGGLRPGQSWTVPALEAAGVAYGTNRHALTDGRDATRADELVAAARQVATRHAALLTDEDLTAAAYALPGMAVGRAEVISRFDRRIPDVPADGVRTLVVAPHLVPTGPGGESAGPAVVPTSYLRAVAERLSRRRALGERLVVQGPVVVTVDLWLTITTQPWAVGDDVRVAVETALRNRLAAVRRSDAVDPWPLGRDLTVSEVRLLAANVPGVADVPRVRVAVSGGEPQDGPVQVTSDGLVVAGRVDVMASVDTVASAGTERPGRGWD
ncbi:hypothetical protein [Geodermatophilus sp. SYSU D00766]